MKMAICMLGIILVPVCSTEIEVSADGQSSLYGISSEAPLVIHLHDSMRGWHQFLHTKDANVKLQHECDAKCEVTDDATIEAGAILFRGDLDTGPTKRSLPSKFKPKEHWPLYGVVHREALSKMPQSSLSQYDFRVTYALEKSRADVIYSYMENFGYWLIKARENHATAASIRENTNFLQPHTGFVHMRCGNWKSMPPFFDAIKDLEYFKALPGRAMRARLLKDMEEATGGRVSSYGRCVPNTEWPEGLHRKKCAVMQRHKFCLTAENSLDPGYHTEKLFDCLKCGSVPVYFGSRTHVERFLPGPHAVIFVDDFKSASALAAELAFLDRNVTAYNKHLEWVQKPDSDWLEFMRSLSNTGVACRLCRWLHLKRSEII